MEPSILTKEPCKARGRPGGVLPADYDHALLLDRFHGQRNMDLKALCPKLGISRQHFYDIINGRVNPTRERVEIVAKALGIDPEQVFRSPSN